MHKHGELIGKILEKRSITDEAEIDAFLNPDYERGLHDPFLMRDMERACVRLYEAIDAGEKIVIYADYDCDGIPGAVILRDLFRLVGYENYEVYIPQRNSEGYGLNIAAIKQFADAGVKLLITIDLGITAVEEVAQAEVFGIDVIITDHHLPRVEASQDGHSSLALPRAYAILNPKTDNYPEKMLCGAGVAFKFAQGFIKKYGELYKIKSGAEKWMLDMAGLATLSDMVPLLGENRVIAHFGLKVLRKSPRLGLRALLRRINIDQANLTEDDIGFMIAPRLNAASRMSDPRRAYELLIADSRSEAEKLADHLSDINDERKVIVAGIIREVNKRLRQREPREVIVIGDPKWRVGVLGLVAGRLSDEYRRPAFVWGKDESDAIKGSCRSDGSVSVVELMTETRESFIDFGGHEQAGGFTVRSDSIHFLEETLSGSYAKVKREQKSADADIDIAGDLSLVNMENWRELEKLAPFGLGNPKPVFLFENVKMDKARTFGKNGSGEHLEVVFSDTGGNRTKAVAFFAGGNSFQAPVREGATAKLLGTFDLSRYGGRQELRLRIVDITN